MKSSKAPPPRVGLKEASAANIADRNKARAAAAANAQRDKARAKIVAAKQGQTPKLSDAVRGVTRRDETAWLLFRALARGDFHHDFGENQPTRDKITKDDESRFFEIAKLVTTKGSVWLRSRFKENIGQNLYNLINDKIDIILPDNPESAKIPLTPEMTAIKAAGVNPGEFANEDELLSFIGLNWVALKAEIVAADALKGAVVGAALPKRKYATNIIPGGREYEIRSCPYRESLDRKAANYKTNRPPSEVLEIVTGGKTSFACIIDASGGFPFSDLRNRDLLARDNAGKTVYVIENIENGADSATKILPPPILPKGKVVDPKLNAPPKLRTLRDTENTVNYPLWANNADPKSNIYSVLHIVLNRINENAIEANLLVRDAGGKTIESYSIGDVSTASNVKNATLYALATILEKGGITNAALVYTLIKRMGDWCQALSLLDLDRVYTVIDPDGREAPQQTTLRELQAGGTEVGIVTNDRILLAFCMVLGVNVYYTSAMDIARLLYFKNTLDTPSGEAVITRINDTLRGIPGVAEKAIAQVAQGGLERGLDAIVLEVVTEILGKIDGHIASIKTSRDQYIAKNLGTIVLPDYIFSLRNLLSNLARLRLDLQQLKVQAENALAVVRDEVNTEPITRLGAANTLLSVVTKIGMDIDYNNSLLADIERGLYPNSRAEKIRLDDLTGRLASGGRLAKSVGVTESKDILRETRNDIQQLLGKSINLLVGLPEKPLLLRAVATEFALPADPTKRENTILTYTEILSVMSVLQPLLPGQAGVQRGGDENGLAVLARAYAALTTRSIRVLVRGVLEITSTPNVYTLGTTYYDRALRGYTVADEYIITEEDLPTFRDGFVGAGIAALTPDARYQLRWIALRYLLLRVDIARIELEALMEDVVGRVPASDANAMEVAEPVGGPKAAPVLGDEMVDGPVPLGAPPRARVGLDDDVVLDGPPLEVGPDMNDGLDGLLGPPQPPPAPGVGRPKAAVGLGPDMDDDDDGKVGDEDMRVGAPLGRPRAAVGRGRYLGGDGEGAPVGGPPALNEDTAALGLELSRADADQQGEGALDKVDAALKDKPKNEYLGALVPGTSGYARLESLKVLEKGITTSIAVFPTLEKNPPKGFLDTIKSINTPPGPEDAVPLPQPASVLWLEVSSKLDTLRTDLLGRIAALEPPAALKVVRDAERQKTKEIEESLGRLTKTIQDVRIVDVFVQKNTALLKIAIPALVGPGADQARGELEQLGDLLRTAIAEQLLKDPGESDIVPADKIVNKIPDLAQLFVNAFIEWTGAVNPKLVTPPEGAAGAELEAWEKGVTAWVDKIKQAFAAHIRLVGLKLDAPVAPAVGGRRGLFGGRRKRKTPQ